MQRDHSPAVADDGLHPHVGDAHAADDPEVVLRQAGDRVDEVHVQRALVGGRDLQEVDAVQEVDLANFVAAAPVGAEVRLTATSSRRPEPRRLALLVRRTT